MTERRCQECTTFYDKKLGVCPECDTPAYGFSKPLQTGRVNGHLYSMANSAHREAQLERSLRRR